MNTKAAEATAAGTCGVLFDLDGVVTRTAGLHAAAWKGMFDAFLAERGEPAFDPDDDYRRYVDGKPRYDGVADFLAARGIAIPYGEPDDPSFRFTVCGLGNRKNELFRELVRVRGVQVFDATLGLIDALRGRGVATAVVTSSRNGRYIVLHAGLSSRFDAVVDGEDAATLGLAGKPAPDAYWEAARRLRCPPSRSAVVEDALVGVEAGRRGGFATVIGVDRQRQAGALGRAGADRVVEGMAEVDPGWLAGLPVPDALKRPDLFAARLEGKTPALFLDFDGTLAAIVRHPEKARIDPAARARLVRISRVLPVAVISGRDLDDVRARVGVDGIHYAGSHGFDIAGPGRRRQLQQGRRFLPNLDRAETALRDALGAVDGVLFDRKRFSLAVHYRQVAEPDVPRVREGVDEAARREGLRRTSGKNVFELQPDVDWDKGRAVRWLMDALAVRTDGSLPIYIGDDVTDEDVFRELAVDGAGIVVDEDERPTLAGFRLRDVQAVATFLEMLERHARG